MQARAVRIHALVKRKLRLTDGNSRSASQDVQARIGLIRCIPHAILNYRLFPAEFIAVMKNVSTKTTENKVGLLYTVILGLLAETYECGNCSDQAALGFYEFLKAGIDKSLEVININLNNGGSHILLALNRNAHFDVAQPEQWRDVIIFDTWNNASLRVFTGDEHANLGYWLESTTAVDSSRRIENNLTATEWSDIIILLQNLKEFLTPKTLNSCIKKNHPEEIEIKDGCFNLEEECKRIIGKIDQEIKLLRTLQKNPPSAPSSILIEYLLTLADAEEIDDRINVPYKTAKNEYFTQLADIQGTMLNREIIKINKGNQTVSFFKPWLVQLSKHQEHNSDTTFEMIKNCGK